MIVIGSIIAERPSEINVAPINPTTAALTPLINADAAGELRKRLMKNPLAMTKMNDGKKMAPVATMAPGVP